MVDITILLPELRRVVSGLVEDFRGRAATEAPIDRSLRHVYQQYHDEGRTSQAFETWREDYLEQVGVAWVLACLFIRYMEDNGLIAECWLAGEGERRRLAEDAHERYFRRHPHETDREYFLHVFRQVGSIPAAAELFDERKTLLWALAPSGDVAMQLLRFWREIDPETGGLLWTFERATIDDPNFYRAVESLQENPLQLDASEKSNRVQFLGTAYQDLSERARKQYALLQTPHFIESFILDRTMDLAIGEFGLVGLRGIDPACGSGHFLIGMFERLFKRWSHPDYTTGNAISDAQKALESIYGVVINPFAVAIARFRLTVGAMYACHIDRLRDAPRWKLNLAIGDSLLFGSRPTFGGERVPLPQQQRLFEIPAIYAVEEPEASQEYLSLGYHFVVGNPPYIIVRDRAQNAAYRQLYSTCHQKYSLGVPFTQRFWDLAIRKGERVNDNAEAVSPAAGYVGMITANSFMKREFGKKLIEEFFPKIDLTHVIDTSGAYIPGHGTPTVILLGRARKPVDNTVRAVLGIKGEPTTPDDPSQGMVWQSVLRQIDIAEAQDEYTSTADVPRATFNAHPWSIGGGGAAELKEQLEEGRQSLSELVESIGFMAITGEDDVFLAPQQLLVRSQVPFRPFCTGDVVRDWSTQNDDVVAFPYRQSGDQVGALSEEHFGRGLAYFWPTRTVLKSRSMFDKTPEEHGILWYEYMQLIRERMTADIAIAFAEVATHNHFVLDRGGKVFKQTAPIIKLPAEATEEDHLALLGLLNSSTACFWLKQVCFPKGGDHVGTEGARVRRSLWDERYAFSATPVGNLPIPEAKPLSLSRRLDEIARQIGDLAASRILERWAKGQDLKKLIEEAEAKAGRFRGLMISLQEELDWECYRHYGLLADDLRYPGDDLPDLKLGERAFEIVMARQMKRGELQTSWFERHGSTPITEVPAHWPLAYRSLVERRIKLIETNKEIGLIERSEYKRRWNTEPWADQVQRALQNWLLDRLESPAYWPNVEPQTTARLADRASADAEFMQVAALYRGRPDFDVAALVGELVEAESVPFLPILRYKPSGLRKRGLWERTWDLQRKEDAGEEVDDIPVPPKYTSADFLKPDYWRLRGKLDVPKERWVSYPHCSTDSDPSLLVGWAGWNHLEQATAIVGYYDARKRDGWDAKRLTPLLAGLDQLLPWIHQWHPEVDAEFGETAGKSFQTMLEHDAHELGLTLDDIRQWTPPAKGGRRKAEGGGRRGRGTPPSAFRLPPSGAEDDE
jgi:hypothetical protein